MEKLTSLTEGKFFIFLLSVCSLVIPGFGISKELDFNSEISSFQIILNCVYYSLPLVLIGIVFSMVFSSLLEMKYKSEDEEYGFALLISALMALGSFYTARSAYSILHFAQSYIGFETFLYVWSFGIFLIIISRLYKISHKTKK